MTKEEIIKISVEEFSRVQDWMRLMEKDSAACDSMKRRCMELKVILASPDVDITGLESIK